MNIEFKKIRTKKDLVNYTKAIGSMVNDGVSKINALNDSMVSIVDKGITYGQSLTEGLKVMANQVQDIMILDGYMASRVSPFESLSFKSTNVILDKESLTIRLENEKIKKASIKDIVFKINGREEVFDKPSFLAETKTAKMQSRDSILNLTTEITLSEEMTISELRFDIEDNGTKYPKIKSISILSADGSISQPIIYNSNSKSYAVNSNTETIRFAPTVGSKIIIEIVKDDSYLSGTNNVYEILLNSISIYESSSHSDGEIIFGPIKSDDQILKAGVFFVSPNEVNAYISTNGEDWNQVSNINSIASISPVVNFNNIDQESIQVDEVVKTIYVKLSLKALNVVPDNYSDKYIIRTITSDDGYAELSYDEGQKISGVYEAIGKTYGRIAISTINPAKYKKPFGIIGTEKLSLIDNEETYIFQDVKLKIYTDADKLSMLPNSGSTTNLYAGNSISIYTQSIPRLESVAKNTNLNCCLKLKVPSGVYYLSHGTDEWIMDLSSGHTRSIDCFNLLAVEGASVVVKDQWGATIGNVSAQLVNGRYVVSLYDVFFEPINNASFNKFYPYGDVDNTYSISCGKIVARKQDIQIVDAYIQYETPIKKKILKNSVKKDIILDRPFVAKESQNLNKYIFKHAAKLNHCKILKGSVKVDTSNAAIQAMNNEVEYIDGVSEFTRYATSKYVVPQTPLNIITLNGLKKDGEIFFSGETDLFINRVFSQEELLFRGDYLVENDSIRLPSGIETSRFISTEIVYESRLSNNPNGLYSIDYENGIIYTQNKIYENVVVSYMHSTLYATYIAVENVPSEQYTDTGSSVIIYGSAESYFLETVPAESKIQAILTSPIIKDIEIRYTT